MQLCLFEESYDVWLTYPTGKMSSMWRFQTVDLKTFFRRLCVSIYIFHEDVGKGNCLCINRDKVGL